MTRSVVFLAACAFAVGNDTNEGHKIVLPLSTAASSWVPVGLKAHKEKEEARMSGMSLTELIKQLQPSLVSKIRTLMPSALLQLATGKKNDQLPATTDEAFTEAIANNPSLGDARTQLDQMILTAEGELQDLQNDCQTTYDKAKYDLGLISSEIAEASAKNMYYANIEKRNDAEWARLKNNDIPDQTTAKTTFDQDCADKKLEMENLQSDINADYIISQDIMNIIARCGQEDEQARLVQQCKRGNHTYTKVSKAFLERLAQLTGPARVAAMKALKMMMHSKGAKHSSDVVTTTTQAPWPAPNDTASVVTDSAAIMEAFAAANPDMDMEYNDWYNELNESLSEAERIDLKDIQKHEANPQIPPSDCTLSESSCQTMNDIFQPIDAELANQATAITTQLSNHITFCSDESGLMDADLGTMNVNMNNAREKADDAKDSKIRNRKLAAAKSEEMEAVESQWTDVDEPACSEGINTYTSEKCALGQIKEKLLQMNGINPLIMDCAMGAWAEGACNHECVDLTDPNNTLGMRTDTRTILEEPSEAGAGCPPFTRLMPCNRKWCPVNCVVGEWEDWGECSVECGGGSSERHRTATLGQAPGDTNCPPQDSKSCNSFSCDADCTLEEWSDWSPCSRQCGQGFRTQFRAIDEEARGDGTCAPVDDLSRMQKEICGATPCIPPPPAMYVECAQATEILMVLDTSSSMTITQIDGVRKAAFAVMMQYDNIDVTNNGDGESGASHPFPMCFSAAGVVAFSGPDFMPTDGFTETEGLMWAYRVYNFCKKRSAWKCYKDQFKTGGKKKPCGVAPGGYPMNKDIRTAAGFKGRFDEYGDNELRIMWRACGVKQIQPADMDLDLFETIDRCETPSGQDRPQVPDRDSPGNPQWQALKNEINNFEIIHKGTCLTQALGMMEHIHTQSVTPKQVRARNHDVVFGTRMLVVTDGDPADMDAVIAKVAELRNTYGMVVNFLLVNMGDVKLEENLPMCTGAVSEDPEANDNLYDHCKVLEAPTELVNPWMTNQILVSMCGAISDTTKNACDNPTWVDEFLDTHPHLGMNPLATPSFSGQFEGAFMA